MIVILFIYILIFIMKLDKFEFYNLNYIDLIKSKNNKIIFVLGGPGVGKGTQCEKLANEFNIININVGNLLRNIIKDEENKIIRLNKLRKDKIKECIKNGEIIPPRITVKIIINEIIKNIGLMQNNKNMIIIDGFPRNIGNMKLFMKFLKNKSNIQIKECIYFNTSDEILLERILNRAKTSKRIDDNIESFNKRLLIFKNNTIPVINEFKKMEILKEINASRSINEIYNNFRKEILKFM